MTSYQGNILIKNPATPTGPNANGSAPGMWRLDEVAYWVKQGVWPNPNIMSDQYFPYVSLLLSSTSLGNANNNLFVDSSGAFNPISRNGNATQGSVTPYSANWSNYFDGSGDYLTVPSSSAFNYGTGDFTIECWGYRGSSSNFWCGYSASGVSFTLFSYAGASSTIQVYSSGFYDSGINPGYNTWFHVAVTRSSGTLRIFINGVQGFSGSYTTNIASHAVRIGSSTSDEWGLGNVSNLRVVKGTAVYTAAFTPPTSALTAITNTSLLTCQSNRFIDNSSNAFTITVTGDTRVTDFAPFAPASPGIVYNQSDITNWSGYFDGSGDYLTSTSANTANAMGTGDWTVEGWVYRTSGAIDTVVFDTVGVGAAAADYIRIFVNTAGGVSFWKYSTATTTTSSVMPIGAWSHFAVVRQSGSIKIYINGVQGNTTYTDTGSNYVCSASRPSIGINGYDNASNPFAGYISNIRAVKGTAVYTSAFTPPTTNLTAISGTSLLTLQNAAFTDNSTNNFIITQFGNTTVTGNSPFNTVGYWSNYFDGSGDYLSSSATTIANFGTGDFTVECWVYSLATGQLNILDFRGTGGTGNAFRLGQVAATGKFAAGWGSNDTVLSSTTNIILNQWTHIAVTRSGSTARMFINGALEATATSSTDIPDSGLIVASYTGSTAFFNGYISNARVVKGTAVYTAAFTPPTTPLTAITNTSLLTCQNGRFIDNSTNAFTITRNGDVTVQSFDPFYTATIASNGGSMYFDGSGDYLSFPSGDKVQFGTGDFTVELWAYPQNAASTSYYYIDGRNTGQTGTWAFYRNSANQIEWYNGSSGFGSTTAIQNAWNHIVYCRSGTTGRTFLNGALVGTFTDTTNYSLAPTRSYIGSRYDGSEGINGYMGGVRITKSALYTAAFTPPTTPATPSANTLLLVNGMNAGIYDATAINDMETVGNAQVSTAVSKFGGSSMYFDGSGDYLLTPSNPAYGLASSSFTIEAWVYVTSSSEPYQAVVKAVGSGSNNLMFIDYSGGSTGVLSSQSGGTSATRSGVTLNTWHHLAVVRNGTSVTCYVNGVGGTSQTIDPGSSGSVSLLVGYDGGTSPARYFNGYIDDLRITKGVARYTSNFTPPTQAFPPY